MPLSSRILADQAAELLGLSTPTFGNCSLEVRSRAVRSGLGCSAGFFLPMSTQRRIHGHASAGWCRGTRWPPTQDGPRSATRTLGKTAYFPASKGSLQSSNTNENRALTPVVLAALLLSGLLPTVAHARKTRTCGFYNAGAPATIVGTRGDDVLRGTPNSDRIAGLGGDDIIRGGDGDDTICGGRGNDVVFGGGWDDFIRGGRGEDRLYEQLGDWGALSGGPGNDLLHGGVAIRDRDEINYRTARRGVNIDLAAGVATGQGRDTLVNIGSVVGSPFDDTIYHGPGGPPAGLYELVAGDGDDNLTMAYGVSYPDGGYGDDTYNILEGAAWDEMSDAGGHDTYNICNDRFSRDWTPSQDLDKDNDFEVHFC